jgi:hypothetical protein
VLGNASGGVNALRMSYLDSDYLGSTLGINGSSGNVFLSANAYLSTAGANTMKYSYSGYGASMLTLGNDGSFSFDRASTGTGGNTITWSRSLTADLSGNLTVIGRFESQALIVTNLASFTPPATAYGSAMWSSNGYLYAVCWISGTSTNTTQLASPSP